MEYRLDRSLCYDDVFIISKASNVRNQILAHCKYIRNKLVHFGELVVPFVGCLCVCFNRLCVSSKIKRKPERSCAFIALINLKSIH